MVSWAYAGAPANTNAATAATAIRCVSVMAVLRMAFLRNQSRK
jgi:hypothetical protein